MAYNRNNNNSSSRYSNSRYSKDRNEDNRNSNYRSNAGSRGGRQQQQQQQKTEYLPILMLFSNDTGKRRSLDVKQHPALQETLSESQFLHIMRKLYNGEITIHGSLFDCDQRYADMQGNIRLSEEQLDELLADYEDKRPSTKTKKAPARQNKAPAKPVYQEPADEDDVEYEEGEFSEDQPEDEADIPY